MLKLGLMICKSWRRESSFLNLGNLNTERMVIRAQTLEVLNFRYENSNIKRKMGKE